MIQYAHKDDMIIAFRGCKFSVFKPVGICHSCFKKQFINGLKNFERDGYFKVSAGRVIVNWNKCLTARSWSECDGADPTWGRILTRLVDLDVLSLEADGNYLVERDDVFLLLYADKRYYFVWQKDPFDFIEAYRDLYGLTKEGFMILKLISVYRT